MSNAAPTPCAPPDEHLPTLSELTDALLRSYRADPRGCRIGRHFLPSREEIIAITRELLQLVYPGYMGRQDLTEESVGMHVGSVLAEVETRLSSQVRLCLAHGDELCGTQPDTEACAQRARSITRRYLAGLPALRTVLVDDVQAAYDGDPAATNLDEVILAYPGLLAITVYRLAHALHELGVPLMPRIMTEWAHARTGADIHPGARIGRSFFIDHATGAVVGETTDIGAGVKLYQGVTLGALSHPKDERGRVIRGTKRHPTVEDGVTVYANATVLGGTTVLGKGTVVGGSVFLTQSTPEGSKVAMKPPELRVLVGGSEQVTTPAAPGSGNGRP